MRRPVEVGEAVSQERNPRGNSDTQIQEILAWQTLPRGDPLSVPTVAVSDLLIIERASVPSQLIPHYLEERSEFSGMELFSSWIELTWSPTNTPKHRTFYV